jgi:hypothetical protein
MTSTVINITIITTIIMIIITDILDGKETQSEEGEGRVRGTGEHRGVPCTGTTAVAQL